VLRGEKTIAQIASEKGVPPNRISQGTATALDRCPSLFEKDHAERLAHEKPLRELSAEIGRLTTPIAWRRI
jgi:hypothetical protein